MLPTWHVRIPGPWHADGVQPGEDSLGATSKTNQEIRPAAWMPSGTPSVAAAVAKARPRVAGQTLGFGLIRIRLCTLHFSQSGLSSGKLYCQRRVVGHPAGH